MPSHSAETVIDVRACEGGEQLVTAELACGCRVHVQVPDDRVIDIGQGERLLVGKYPCPLEHPVRPPR